MMADGTSLGDRIASLSPRCGARSACRPFISRMVVAASPATARASLIARSSWPTAPPRADDPRRRAFEDYQKRLTEAWKNP